MNFFKTPLLIALLTTLAASSDIFVAIEEGNVELCKALLKAGADVNELRSNITPLIQSILMSPTKECFDCILKDENVDLHAVDEEGYTALHHAVTVKDGKEMCAALLEQGANVNSQDFDSWNSGNTPLLLSIISSPTKECFDCILKDKKVDVHAVNRQGYTALHYAVTVKDGKEKCAALLDQGADVNSQDCDAQYSYGFTPLITAVLGGNKVSLEFILKHEKVKVNAPDKLGYTALHHAASIEKVDGKENTHACGALLAKGANVNARNNGNTNTPLISAIQLDKNECAKMMLRKDVKLEIKNGNDQTALDIARDYENDEMVKILENVRYFNQRPLIRIRGYVAGSLKRLGERNALVFKNIKI